MGLSGFKRLVRGGVTKYRRPFKAAMKFLPPQRATAEFSDSRRGFRPRKKGKATAIARVVCEALDVRLQDLIQFQKPSMRDSKRFLTRCKGSVFTIRRRFSIRSGFVNQRHAGSNGWLMARKPRKPAPRETVEPRAGRRCEYCRAPQPATGTRVFPDWLGRYFRAPAQPILRIISHLPWLFGAGNSGP